MKISIIVGGRFHAFNLAQQIEKKKLLHRLITSYPKYFVKNYKIDVSRVKSIFLKEIVTKFLNYVPILKKFFDWDSFICNYFDYRASKCIDYVNTDIIVGWSSFSKETFEKAKNFNCVKILERGSTHIVFQNDILLKEYKKLEILPQLPSKKIIDKELKEYKMCDFICVPSEFARKTFLDKGFSKNKIIKIPYGVNLKEFYRDVEIRKKNQPNCFRIISTGTASVRKGTLYLLKAFEELDLQNAELLIIGPVENDFQDIVSKYKNNKKIKFIKKQAQNNLNYFYNISDIFITCSIEEGLAMVQVQAMACGLPVICTPNSGGGEIVDHGINGFILPIRNTKILKEKIMELYHNPNQLNLLSNNAYNKAKESLSWDSYGEKIIEFYKNSIKNKSK